MTIGQWEAQEESTETLRKATILSIAEADLTELLSSLTTAWLCISYMFPGTLKQTSGSQNHLRDAKLQPNKTITEAAVQFQTH